MKIVAFAGGVGGAKLAYGLAFNLPPENLTIIVNTGDDFEHWGLKISPDIDTVCYTLAGLANPETGWGRKDETWQVFDQVKNLGGDDWFRIGDKDLATHLERTRRLNNQAPLSTVTRDFCTSWNIPQTVLPMSDHQVSTIVDTDQLGEIPFQEYFVHQRCEPIVKGFRFSGIEHALPADGVIESIQAADAIIICPSNPWVSIDPILSLPGIIPSLKGKKIAAISPIVGGQAVKGPAAKMFTELNIPPTPYAVAMHYQPILTDFVLDVQDAQWAAPIAQAGIRTLTINTMMRNNTDRIQLAQDVLNFIRKD
jgi:LPPG:FO 2-phospho-L-lactate transferase